MRPGLDLGIIEHVIDHREQRIARALEGLREFAALLRIEPGIASSRFANPSTPFIGVRIFVAHHGEELGLGARCVFGATRLNLSVLLRLPQAACESREVPTQRASSAVTLSLNTPKPARIEKQRHRREGYQPRLPDGTEASSSRSRTHMSMPTTPTKRPALS